MELSYPGARERNSGFASFKLFSRMAQTDCSSLLKKSGSPHPPQKANGVAKGLGALWACNKPRKVCCPAITLRCCPLLSALRKTSFVGKRIRTDLGLSDAHLVINASIVNRMQSAYTEAWIVPWGQGGWIFLGCIRASHKITSGAKCCNVNCAICKCTGELGCHANRGRPGFPFWPVVQILRLNSLTATSLSLLLGPKVFG